jgi:hypothetical protein
MKKLVLLNCFILLLVNYLNAQTLNGVDAGTATTMIGNFAKYYSFDTGPKSVSAWYSADQIRAINTQLIKEHSDPNYLTDGVRIYFGSDVPQAPKTKLNVKIFLVSTKLRNPLVAGLSSHIDYYNHTAGTLSGTEIAISTNDHGDKVRDMGGSLYNSKAPVTGYCTNPSTHFLASGDAYKWVQARYELNPKPDTSSYNTESEWFSYCFINYIFNIISDTTNNFTGLRIYLGKGFKDTTGKIRDVFILVPTYAVGTLNADSYNCLEELVTYPCAEDEKKIRILRAASKSNRSLFLSLGAAYDEGELCPTNCTY